jgi:hypothetical protein
MDLLPEGEHLANTFGCYEMELAAVAIIKKLRAWGSRVYVEDFMKDRQMMVGFVMLAAHGWLVPDYPNGHLLLIRNFGNVLKKH